MNSEIVKAEAISISFRTLLAKSASRLRNAADIYSPLPTP